MSESLEKLAPMGKYRLLRELGRGGTGIVYEAVDTSLDRRVALKVLAENPLASAEVREEDLARFLREAKLTAKLPKHPSVVGLYEADVLDGRRFLAMEFVEGIPLSEWSEKEGVDLRRKVEVLRDAALAVHHAHENGVIHRDLKPGNILVDAQGRPHLTDFGLAKQVGADVSLTGGGLVVGTPHYMSPEQAQGLKSLDHRTDVYSLGIMLYEFLAGRRPFEGDSAMQVMMQAVRTSPPPPTGVVRGAGGESARGLDKICLKAIAKKPDQRYSTARSFAEDLTTWLRGETVQVRTGKTTRRLVPAPPPASRARLWTLVAAGAIVAAVGLSLLVNSRNGVQPPSPPAQPPQRSLLPGAIGEYFVGHNFEALVRRVVDPRIDFDWSGKEPWPDGPLENYSVRWRGLFEVAQSGSLVLLVHNDDGARLSVDGQEVWEHWSPHAASLDSVTLTLEKGFHRFTLDYHQGIREAVIQFSQRREDVVEPIAVFHHAADFQALDLPSGGREDVPGAQEGESLPILEGSGTWNMPYGDWAKYRRGRWSGSSHLWWGAKVKVGDRLRLGFQSPEAGRKTVVLCMTKAKDHGIHQVLVNGVVLSKGLDLYDPGLPMLEMEFRNVELKAGDNELEFLVVGSNPQASEWGRGRGLYKLGLDYVLVK